MLITVMSERELHVPRLGRDRRRSRLPPGGGDEPVRRRRHGAHLAAPSTTACAGSASTTSRRTRRRRSSPRAAPTADDRVAGEDRRARPADPRRTPTCASARRCAARSTPPPSCRRSPRCASSRSPRRRSASTPIADRAVRPGAPARGLAAHEPRRSSPSCGTTVFGDRGSADGDGANTGKATAPTGASPGLKEGRAGAPTPSTRPSGRRRRGASSARHRSFEQVSPEVGELDEAAFDDLMRERPRRGAGAARRHDPRRPTPGCASWPGASPAG